MTKITQLISGGTYRLVKFLRSHSSKVKAHTQKKSESTDRSGKLPKITQFTYGSTEMLGNFPKVTELSYGSRVVRQLA